MRAPLALLALSAALACATPAAADPPRPANVVVQGGEGAWHADRRFVIGWTRPARTDLGLRYSVADPEGNFVLTGRTEEPDHQLVVEVPATPAVYTARFRYEDREGLDGPIAQAKLRFDGARPGAIAPATPAGWVSRDDFPLTIRLGPPAGSPPLSGVRGYAVALGQAPESPCVLPGFCTEAETDVRDGDELTVAALPDGAVEMAAVAVSGAGLASPAVARRTLQVDTSPPETRLRGLPPGWTRGPVRLSVGATDTESGMAGERAYTAIQLDGGTPRIASRGSAEAALIEEGIHRIEYWAGDSAGNADDGARVNGRLNPPPRRATVRIDRTPPRAAFLPRDPADPELLRARIADERSGPDAERGWIGVRPLGSHERFRRLPATPGGEDELRARWDSDAYPLGLYEFRAEVRDRAGNRATTTRRAGGAAMIVANPVKAPTVLAAGFGGSVLRWHRCRRVRGQRRCARQTIADFDRRPVRRKVPFGRGMLLSGRLRAGAGAGPRPVRIAERLAGDARPVSRAWTVWTGPDGSFATRLAPGPSREVTATYEGDRVLAASAGPALWLGVRSGVRLRASSGFARVGGAPLVFRGRVLAERGEIPDGGVAVELQFRLPGGAWEEFRTIESDRRGRFRLAYRFSDDDSRGVRFQFRARVPKQSQWPYEAGNSRPIAVKGL